MLSINYVKLSTKIVLKLVYVIEIYYICISFKNKDIMTTQELQLEAYNESKEVCMLFINYVGDKRKMGYKRLERMVFEVAARRVNNFGSKLGLPSFNELRGF